MERDLAWLNADRTLARVLQWRPLEARRGPHARRDHSKRSSAAPADDRAALRPAGLLPLSARSIQPGAEHVPRGRLQVTCPTLIKQSLDLGRRDGCGQRRGSRCGAVARRTWLLPHRCASREARNRGARPATGPYFLSFASNAPRLTPRRLAASDWLPPAAVIVRVISLHSSALLYSRRFRRSSGGGSSSAPAHGVDPGSVGSRGSQLSSIEMSSVPQMIAHRSITFC